MENRVESKVKYDSLLWALGVLVAVAGMTGYYYFSEQSILIRAVGLLVALVCTFFVVFQTEQGKNLVVEWREAMLEVRKMVWPTRRETLHTTLAVLAMVVAMGLLLWTADFLLLRAVAWLTGQWGN